ncbi:MAG TPA: zinc ribbon domain-containing protein [Pyrinomonadaceae bacterium]
MFCPSCGTEYSVGLPYCNRCGANLNSALAEPETSISVDITKAVAAIGTTIAVLTLGGFIALIVGAVNLAHNTTIGQDPLVAMILMGMLTILTVDIFLARQLSRLISAGISSKSRSSKRSLPPAAITNHLNRPVTAPLPASMSVTENTTRFLESQYSEPAEVDARARPRDFKS